MQGNNNGIDFESIQKDLYGFLTEQVDVDEYGEIETIPTGIEPLDTALGGGIGIGTFTVAVGYSGSFKSTMSVEVAKAFRKYDPRSPIVYIDTESAMSVQRLKSLGLEGVKTLTGLTVEKVFMTITALESWRESALKEGKIDEKTPILVIWDSIANTPTKTELETLDVNQTIGLKARLLSSTLPKIIDKLRNNRISLYAINQFRDKVSIGPYQSPSELKHMQHDKTMPGGNAIMFNASQLLEFKTIEHKLPEESKYGFRHAKIEVKTVKNKFFPDGVKVQLVINVGKGVHKLFTAYDFLVATKKITTGAWNYLKDYPSVKFRTKDFPDVYKKNKEFAQAFNKVLQETLHEWRNKVMSYDVTDMTLENEIEEEKVTPDDTGEFNLVEESVEEIIKDIPTEESKNE